METNKLTATTFERGRSYNIHHSANVGDKEIVSVMVLKGVQGADINYMTEVADTFTYSLSVGADIYSAENGFSLGLSSGYTFSSHTEDYGLNANLNYVF